MRFHSQLFTRSTRVPSIHGIITLWILLFIVQTVSGADLDLMLLHFGEGLL